MNGVETKHRHSDTTKNTDVIRAEISIHDLAVGPFEYLIGRLLSTNARAWFVKELHR